jgi:hypothetical protein
MLMRIHVNRYRLRGTLCRWTKRLLMHSNSYYWKDAITLRGISLEIPSIQSRICCFKSPMLAGRASYTLLLTYSAGTPLIRTLVIGIGSVFLVNMSWNYRCITLVMIQSILQKARSLQHKILSKCFSAHSFLVLPARQILQFPTTFSSATSKARYLKHVLTIWWHKTANSGAYSRNF